jgi:hypothetical protein
MKGLITSLLLIALLFFTSCNNDVADISSVEERKAAATAELIDALTAPANGWRLNYRPNSFAGTFLVILDFNKDGTVRLQSDLTADDGVYLDQTITYRIDHDLATELIFETYGVFHYLFELNRNTFGGEFELLYKGKAGNNLTFRSKTDAPGNQTTLSFLPASTTDASLISTQIIGQLEQGGYRQKTLVGLSPNASFQIYFPADNLSIFATIDVNNRLALIKGAAIGQSTDAVINSTKKVNINTTVELSFLSEKVLFDRAVEFALDGKNFSFSGFNNTNFIKKDTLYCTESPVASFISFDCQVDNIGTGTMASTIFSSHSTFFDQADEFYIIDPSFLFNENDSSLLPLIDENFKDIAVFALIYKNGFNGYTGTGTFTGMGFAAFDANGKIQWYLREMDVVEQSGNYVKLALTDGTFINVADSLDERNALFEITDEIFQEGKIYGSEVQGIDGIFEIYNPCNGYKFFLNEL